MKRLLVLLVATLAAWLGAGAPAPAIAIPTNVQWSPVYDNDGGFISATPTSATSERGPPPSYGYASCPDAVDRRSRGASARPDGPTPGEARTYDDITVLARDASVTSTTGGHVGVPRGDVSSPERTGVATNAGEDVWKLRPWTRGDKIEDALAGSDYASWDRVGAENNGYFPWWTSRRVTPLCR